MTIESDYSRISLGNIHLEREVLRLQRLSSRIKLCTNVLREEKFNVLLSALVRANRLDEKINNLLLLKISDNYISKMFEDLKQSCCDLRLTL